MFYKKICFLIALTVTIIYSSGILADAKVQQRTSQSAAAAQSATNTATALMPEKIDLENKPWSVLFYVGGTAKQQLGTLVTGNYTSAGETLYTGEFAYTLSMNNPIRKFLYPIVDTLQIANNLTYRDNKNDSGVWEYNAYIIFRWTKFPWREHLYTTFAASEGVSYASHVPLVERGITSTDSRRFLNYLMFELSFAMPSHPNVQLAARVQHRSVAYGVYGNGNSGSNNIGLALRIYF